MEDQAISTDFYPRPPRGGRPLAEMQNIMLRAISIHALREEGDLSCFLRGRKCAGISIHALREEGDHSHSSRWASTLSNFYPRPPRGGRQTKNQPFCPKKLFLSTPSARRATAKAQGLSRHISISIHALREEGDVNACMWLYCSRISIHALREEGDQRLRPLSWRFACYFYPRPPRGGRPKFDEKTGLFENISIHALREEGDFRMLLNSALISLFLSTPSARRATRRA